MLKASQAMLPGAGICAAACLWPWACVARPGRALGSARLVHAPRGLCPAVAEQGRAPALWPFAGGPQLKEAVHGCFSFIFLNFLAA